MIRRPSPRSTAAALVLVLASLGTSCSSTPVSGVADGPPTDLGEIVDLRSEPDPSIEVADNVYTPRAVQVAPGATVTFHNAGSQIHNVTPVDEGTLAAVSLAPTDSAEVTVPTTPGTYRFYCTLHASKDSGLQRGAFVVG